MPRDWPSTAAQAGASLNPAITDPTDAEIQTYANSQYQSYVAFFNQNLGSNWTSSADFQTFNPDFSYQATATQIANFENNATWTTDELTYTVAEVAVDPESGTPVGILTPNIAGTNVTLITGGSIGQISSTINIPTATLESGTLTTAQDTALADASATGDVIVITGTGISVTPAEQIFISATGDVNASAAGSIVIQGASPDLTLNRVTAGSTVNISAQESILSSGTGTQITTPGNTVLKAGTGTVGSPTTPLDVNIGGQIAVYTPPGNIYIVGSQTTELALSANTGSSSTYGESVTFTATISDTGTGTGMPTGNVEFYDGSSDLGAGTLLSSSGTSATWTFTTSTLTVGILSISAYFTPSGDSVGSSGSFNLTVTPAALTITADSASKTYGQTATFAGTAFTDSGLVNGDTISGVTETSTGAAASALGRYLHHRAHRRGGHGLSQLHDHLRQRHADGQPGRLDDHGQQREQDLRADGDLWHHGVHRHRPGRQRRHHHQRDRDQHRIAGIGHGGQLHHRAELPPPGLVSATTRSPTSTAR